jgi:'Cold-shock' DNA-binding domain
MCIDVEPPFFQKPSEEMWVRSRMFPGKFDPFVEIIRVNFLRIMATPCLRYFGINLDNSIPLDQNPFKGRCNEYRHYEMVQHSAGYGFIRLDDGSKDVFVHVSAVERSSVGNPQESQN